MTNWIKPPTIPGWYWWREKPDNEMPVLISEGPFNSNCFVPGRGWLLTSRMGGEWWPERIPYPDE